jgi:hypothetical protein
MAGRLRAKAAILDRMPFLPLPLTRRPEPFSHPDWLFEVKYDGFRSLALVEPSGTSASMPRCLRARVPAKFRRASRLVLALSIGTSANEALSTMKSPRFLIFKDL